MYQTPDWSLGDKYLRENVPELAPLVDKYAPCPLKPKDEKLYFSTLLSGIVAQQLPPDVSQKIMKELGSLLGEPIQPQGIIDLDVDRLHAIGITSQKIDYMKDFARACLNGKITMSNFAEMTDSQITKQLLEIRGLGQWTIEMFLLLCLCRTDVIPSADFIFKKELQKLLNLDEVPKRGKINKLTESWRPWRSLAVWYLWAQAGDK
ncbi:MAG: hypothetical protein Q4D21_09650 [Phascolarctobacterium sp.]|nr:hypothetical protein [Phascolarctobacterium sp.]